MSKNKIIYWSATGIVTLIIVYSAGIYLFEHATVMKFFNALGYPTYLIYPLAIAKLLGLIAILSRKSELLKNLAYAGFFYDFILAFFAHIMAGGAGYEFAGVAFIGLIFSFIYERKVFDTSKEVSFAS